MLVPVIVYVTVSPAETAVPEAGSADLLIVKPDPMTGCSVVTAGGTIGSPGTCGPVGSPGFGVVGVAVPLTVFCRTSTSATASTVTE